MTCCSGTINGVPTVLAGCSAGIVNRPTAGGNWSIIPPGGMSRGYFSVSDSKGNSVVAICFGVPWIGHIIVREPID